MRDSLSPSKRVNRSWWVLLFPEESRFTLGRNGQSLLVSVSNPVNAEQQPGGSIAVPCATCFLPMRSRSQTHMNMQTCIHTHMHTTIHTVHRYIHAHGRESTYACTHTQARTHTLVHTHIHTQTHTYQYTTHTH